ncbi:MAG: fatty acid oxidation complex subunit alpha FadB [Bacteriovoracaceae bacterium]|nr:fatty acid oxidation complex subunit alpha FadB [Bacteriovoracaceae bacterium]
MEFQGKNLKTEFDGTFLNLIFGREGSAPNVLGADTLAELEVFLSKLSEHASKVKGLLISSQKDHFILGADITEFPHHFKREKNEMMKWLGHVNKLFNQFEDMPIPTVSLINGMAFGGGFEICLATDFRLMSTAPSAKVGLLETKLGIIPGWGGTVRLPRLAGADNAIEWITSGNQYGANEAYKIGAVDGMVAPDQLKAAGLSLLTRIHKNELPDWEKNRKRKKAPMLLNKVESPMVFDVSKGFVLGLTKGQYPAPIKAIEVMEAGSRKNRDEALAIESEGFADLTSTKVASSLVQIFLSDQAIKKQAKQVSEEAKNIENFAVLGAGIMGGGIAYQAASQKVSNVIMKDISQSSIDTGVKEAVGLFTKLAERGKVTPAQVAQGLQRIKTSLNYDNFSSVQYVVEAVVEKESVKAQVLKEIEEVTGRDTVITSNTSTISIAKLAQNLKYPERFCGMHFFNPVPKMPLVEIIRGPKTSESTINQAVKFALQLGKTPIVVNDCPGFLVNRVLFPYFFAFNELIADGIEWTRIDKVMEKFGWPMGPAFLLDVVGIDTGTHAAKIMAQGFPDRMIMSAGNIIELMFQANRFGQKNGLGFYEYKMDAKGKPVKELNPTIFASMMKQATKKTLTLTDQEIVDRMMLPMLFEAARCLEEKIVNTANEIDAGLLLGLGFPPFRGGIMKYCDDWGLDNVVASAKKWESVGAMYKVPNYLLEQQKQNKKFYQF